MNKKNSQVEEFLNKAEQWQEEFKQLRAICLDCDLTEDFKWMHPSYTFQDNNIVLIHGFKEYCALLFHKGTLLKDPEDILIQQTENTQAARQLRFTGVQEIVEQEQVIKDYIREAVEVEKAGLEVEFKKTKEYDVPEEFQQQLDEMPELKEAFEGLTPGRQRGYLLHFSGAKQSKTRQRRVQKCIPKILKGKGLRDR